MTAGVFYLDSNMNSRATLIEHLTKTWKPQLVSPYHYIEEPRDLTGTRWLFPAEKFWHSFGSVCNLPSTTDTFGVITAIHFQSTVIDEVDSAVNLYFVVRRPGKDLRLEFFMQTACTSDGDNSAVQCAIDEPEPYTRMDLFSPGFMTYDLTTIRIALCAKTTRDFFVEVIYLPEKWKSQTIQTGEWTVHFDEETFKWYHCSDPDRYRMYRTMVQMDDRYNPRTLLEYDPCLYCEKDAVVRLLDHRLHPLKTAEKQLYKLQFCQ
jgi:hypothetical protein